jgi:N utilization substance protein B
VWQKAKELFMAGGRKEARQWAMQILYERDINPRALEEVFDDFWSERNPGKRDRAFTEETVRGVLEHQAEIDGLLKKHAPDWEVKRLGGVDRNVMRIALFEMRFREDIPPVVSINEAVQNAKDYSSDESGRFVNGILDEYRRTLDRPARSAWKDPQAREEGRD